MIMPTIEELKDLAYRCQFRTVLDMTESAFAAEPRGAKKVEIGILRAFSLFERNLVNEALELLKTVAGFCNTDESEELIYARAHLACLMEDKKQALQLCKKLTEISTSQRYRFRAGLIEGTIWLDDKNFKPIAELLEHLRPLSEHLGLDDRISLLVLRAGYERDAMTNFEMARHTFLEAIKLASQKSWMHFINRCMFGMALNAKQKGDFDEFQNIVRLMKNMVNPDESLFFIHLVNQFFQDENVAVTMPLKFDTERMQVNVLGKSVALHDKPLIFQFLVALHGRDRFMTKQELSSRLWPDEPYNPAIHDARIFDIAKRTRALIETFEHLPVLLLSGRQGYKLATTN